MNNLGVQQLFVSKNTLGTTDDIIIYNPNGTELVISKNIAVGSPENVLATLDQVRSLVGPGADDLRIQLNKLEKTTMSDLNQLKIDVNRLIILINSLLILRN